MLIPTDNNQFIKGWLCCLFCRLASHQNILTKLFLKGFMTRQPSEHTHWKIHTKQLLWVETSLQSTRRRIKRV